MIKHTVIEKEKLKNLNRRRNDTRKRRKNGGMSLEDEKEMGTMQPLFLFLALFNFLEVHKTDKRYVSKVFFQSYLISPCFDFSIPIPEKQKSQKFSFFKKLN